MPFNVFPQRYPNIRPLGRVALNLSSPQADKLLAAWNLLPEGAFAFDYKRHFPGSFQASLGFIFDPTFGWVPNFNGTSQYITMAGLHFPSPITVAAWVNFSSTSVSHIICGEWANPGNTWLMYFWNTGAATRFSLNGGSDNWFPTPGTFGANQWHHIAFDSANAQGYFDGIAQAMTGAAQTWASTANDFDIGRWTGSNFMLGQVAEVRIYSGSLSASLIKQMADAPTRWDLYGVARRNFFVLQPATVLFPIQPSVSPFLQPAAVDPGPGFLRMSDIIRTIPTPITNFDRFSSMPFLKPNPPDLPRQLIVSEPPLPFYYNSPGWLVSAPTIPLKPTDIPVPQLQVVQPTPPTPPVVFPRGTLDIRPLSLPDLLQSSILFPPFPAVAPIPPALGCNLTLFMLLQRMYKNLDEDPNFPVYYPRDMAVFCLNWAQRLFCLLTLCLEKTASFNLSGATAHYKISAQISDFMVPLRVSFNGIRVRPRKLGDLNRLGTWSRALTTDGGQTPTTIKYYAQYGMDGLAIYPSLPGTGQLSITYAAIPPDLVANGDIPSIQPEQQVHLPDIATWLIRLPEGAIEGVDLTQMPGQRGLEAMAKYAEFVRARVKGLAYDFEPPLDVSLQDIARMFFKPKREKPN